MGKAGTWRWGLAAALIACAGIAAATVRVPLSDVTQMATGRQHSCALDSAGKVYCWGANGLGQLGLGEDATPTVRPAPVPVPGLSGMRGLASGYGHTCAITAARAVQCWGLNDSGQSGDTSLRYQAATPVDVQGLPGPVRALATGANHSCALLEDGRVSCWGDNRLGQLGDGSSVEARATAGEVQGLGAAVTRIEAGDQHTCALLADGGVRCWGHNRFGQLGDDSTSNRTRPVAVQGLPGPVRALAGGTDSSCAVMHTGALYCWGPQYPLGAFVDGSLRARLYPGFETGYVDVEAGAYHFCALAGNGAVRCIGENVYGQFGTGPIDGSLGVDSPPGLAADVAQLSAGGDHTCARSASGTVQCWGDNRFGQLGIDAISVRLVPTQVSGLTRGIRAVGVGSYHACALTDAGAVHCWGANNAGQLGDGSDRLRLTPVAVPALSSGVRALATGGASNCAITAERRAQCWGANFQGQLGIDLPLSSAPPRDVVGLGNADVVAVSVGDAHACALLDGGGIKCWGDNSHGQIGDGSRETRLRAVDVVGLGSGVRAISAGYRHSCAVLASGGLKCWGLNDVGQLGDGSKIDRLTPTDVVGLSAGVVEVGAGGLHTCARLDDGAVKCWGGSFFGLLLGDESQQDRTIPGDVPALRGGVAALAVSLYHTCVRLQDGAMRCWGGNDGAIGDNSTLGRPTPVEVAGLNRGVSAIAAGYGLGGHTCAVVDGAAQCWGENTYAQIGDGTTHGIPVPQTVVRNELDRQLAAVSAEANAASRRAILDASGRYVLFESEADNLVAGDSNRARDVFLRDRETGLVQRISVDNAGAQITGDAQAAGLSADARLALFVAPDAAVGSLLGESAKSAALRRKNGQLAILLRNLLTGTTQRIASGVQAQAGLNPQLAGNGNAVVYTATTSNPAQGSVGQDNIYVVTLANTGGVVQVGSPRCLTCKSINADGSESTINSNGPSGAAVVSANGKFVAFESQASNLLAATPAPCSGSSDVLLRNLLTGISQRVSTPGQGGQCNGGASTAPSIDASGSVVAFVSSQPLLAGDNNRSNDVFVWTATDAALSRISVAPGGTDANGDSSAPQVSGDGKTVAFLSAASNLDLGFPDNNDRIDLHTANLSGTVLRLSRSATGAEANADSGAPSISYDGSQLAFDSAAASLLGSTIGRQAVFTRANPLVPTKRSATWWLPAESGWGLTVFDQGNVLAPIWFTYDDDSEPTWFLVAGAFAQSDGSFTGDLFRFTGVPYDRISGPAATSASRIGDIRLRYTGLSALQFDYRVGDVRQSKRLQRFAFGTRAFACTASPTLSRANTRNYTDLWTGAGNSNGWGLSLFHVDNAIFAIWYTYDADGEAVFFVVATSQQPDGSFTGDIVRQRDGTPFSRIDGNAPSNGADIVGSARLRFHDGERADFTHTIGGVSQTRAITRLLLGDQATECRAEDVGDR